MNIKNTKQLLSFGKCVQKCKSTDKALVKAVAANERITIKNKNMKNK